MRSCFARTANLRKQVIAKSAEVMQTGFTGQDHGGHGHETHLHSHADDHNAEHGHGGCNGHAHRHGVHSLLLNYLGL